MSGFYLELHHSLYTERVRFHHREIAEATDQWMVALTESFADESRYWLHVTGTRGNIEVVSIKWVGESAWLLMIPLDVRGAATVVDGEVLRVWTLAKVAPPAALMAFAEQVPVA